MLARLLLLVIAFLPPAAFPGETIVLGAEDDWLPYSGVIDGKPAGLAVELVKAAYRAAGAEVELHSLPYARCMALTEAGRLAGCFDTSRDASLERRFRWHAEPLFNARIAIYGRAAPTGRALRVADLRGHRVAVTNGYTYGDEFDLDGSIDRQVVQNDLSALRMLAGGRTEYALVFDQVARWLAARGARDIRGRVHEAGTVKEMALYVSFSPSHPDTERAISLLDKGMSRIRADGTRERILGKWLSGDPQR